MNNNTSQGYTFTPDYSINFSSMLRFLSNPSNTQYDGSTTLLIENLINDVFDSMIFTNIGLTTQDLYHREDNLKKKITKQQFDRLERGYSTKECSICLDINEESVRLPCGHFFHEGCIGRWLMEKSSECPLCKYDCSEV